MVTKSYDPNQHIIERELDPIDYRLMRLELVSGGTITGLVRSDPGCPPEMEYFGLKITRVDGSIQHLLFWSDEEHNTCGYPQLTHLFTEAEDKSLWEHFKIYGKAISFLQVWCAVNHIFILDARRELDQIIEAAYDGVPGYA